MTDTPTTTDQLITFSNVICRVISQAFSAIVVIFIGSIVAGLGGLIGGILIGITLEIFIILITDIPLIGVCVELITYIVCTLIGVIAGGYRGICQGTKLNTI